MFHADAVLDDSGAPDPVNLNAIQHEIADLPDDAMQFLLGSRYCETDILSQEAWRLFENAPTGWGRVQAICDYVHNYLRFNYQDCDPTRTASQAYYKGVGVCRDFAHLAIAFTRCMNIPARYCTGYISDIGLPPPYSDSGFLRLDGAYLGGQWWTFDPRNNAPRVGRILMARGRDAADVPLVQTFGPHMLRHFQVWMEAVAGLRPAQLRANCLQFGLALPFADGRVGEVQRFDFLQHDPARRSAARFACRRRGR